MATVHEAYENADGEGLEHNYVVHVKGAPDKMIPLCRYQARAGLVGQDTLEPIDSDYWMEKIAVLSSHGLRVLSLCRGLLPRDEIQAGQQLGPDFIQSRGPWLAMVGLFAIMDPPRPECIEAIKVAHGAGVRVAMVSPIVLFFLSIGVRNAFLSVSSSVTLIHSTRVTTASRTYL